MTFASPLFFLSGRWLQLIVCAALCAAALVLLVLLTRPAWQALEQEETPLAPVSAREMRDLEALREHLSVLRGEGPTGSGVPFADDFRFAGTFFRYDASGGDAVVRRAVLAHRPSRQQFIVSEGDEIEGVRVGVIRAQEIVLRKDGQEARLRLEGLAAGASGQARTTEPARPEAGAPGGEDANRFGSQHEDGVWRMDRQALMDYYDELLDEPERLLYVFDSMQPLYTDKGTIEGYRLQPVGEQAFFEAVGFRAGDTVRAVNALPMTNRRRAEFFIQQVVANEMSAIVIDLERDGSPVRVVYEIR